MKTWNIGIIGAGMVADFHARAIESLPNTRLAGFCSSDGTNAMKMAGKYSCRHYQDYRELILSDDVDIVTIATPSGFHLEPAVEAANKGKHVICEKPIEITLERIDKMIAAHEKAGTKLGVIYNYRFHDGVRIMKNAVDNGRFGILTNASVYVPWWRSDQYYSNSWRGTKKLDGGGALMNQSSHMIDMLQYIAGPVRSLMAYTATLAHKIEVEDEGVAVLQFRNNALGVIYGTTASFPGQFRRIEITGSEGTAVMEENSFKVWKFRDMKPEDAEILEKYSKVEGGGGVSDPAAIPFEPHAKNIAAFIDSLENNRRLELDGYEARKSVEIILAMYESAATHKMVVLSQS